MKIAQLAESERDKDRGLRRELNKRSRVFGVLKGDFRQGRRVNW